MSTTNKDLANELARLAFELFEINEKGKQFLKLYAQYHNSVCVFPHLENVDRYGGSLGYAAFRAGQKDLIHFIEMLILNANQKEHAEEMKDGE